MSWKKLIAALLCAAMVGTMFAGCGQTDTDNSAQGDAQTQTEVVTEVIDPISDKVNVEDDSLVNYDTNLVSGGSKEDQSEESEEDWVTSLVDNNMSKDEETEEGSVSEKLPDEYVDENGDLKVPFDIAYPDIFNSDEVQYADNAILVKVANTYSEETVAGLKDAGIGKMETMFGVGEDVWYTAYLLKDVDVHEAMEAVRQVSGVKVAEYNYAYEVATVPEDTDPDDTNTEESDNTEETVATAEAEVADNPMVGEQSVLNSYGIKETWSYLRANAAEDQIPTGGGDSGIVVAVIDTGVDYEHVDLKANMWKNTGEIQDNGIDDDGNGIIDDYYGANFTAGGYYTAKGSGMDDHGHGTHVAGIVAASNNKAGVVGIAYNAQIMALKAGDASGYFLNNNIANAILYAYENGADVINMSFGGTASTIAVQDALATAYARCILVASAGNSGAPNEGYGAIPCYPAAFSYVLGVMSAGGTGKNVVESGFTNYDKLAFNAVEYEVYAPGEQILSTLPGDRYGRLSGTSMAAPVVAAQAALLRSYYTDRSMYPTKFIYGQIVGTADEGVECCNPLLHGGHNIPGMINFYDSFIDMPQPDVYLGEYTLFDTVEFSADTEGVLNDYLYELDADGNKVSVNDGNGVVDAGEVIALGFALQNRWGMSENTTVSIDATSDLGVEHPFVTILNNEGVKNGSINYGSIGTYSESDCGKIVENDAWVGWEKPFYLKIDEDCPNDYTITLNVKVTSENALDEEDETVYSTSGTIVLKVRSGYILPDIVREDMTLTKDNYYIIPDSMMIMEGATVTVEPGTYIQFWTNDPNDAYAQNAIVSLTVEGEFICKGTEKEPVKIFPSGWMDSYWVRIVEKNKGYVSMEHTIVTNPNIEITRADNCEFNQNYKAQLRYRYLSGSSVYNSSEITKVAVDYATDCGFYKIGAEEEYSNYQAKVMGCFKRCIFVDSNINYTDIGMIEDCVFYGNNNDWDNPNDGATSKITVYDNYLENMSVGNPFVYADNGSTYLMINNTSNLNTISRRLAKMMGGDYATFETVKEADFVLGNDNVPESYLYIGTVEKDGVLYNADGSVLDEEVLGLSRGTFEYYGYKFLYPESNPLKRIIYNSTGLEHISSNTIVEIPGTIFVSDITFDEFVLDMKVGGTQAINPIVTPSTVNAEDLVYDSQNDKVATVDENGVVTATGIGTTTVRVYAPDLAVYNFITVNVREKVELESIQITAGEAKTLEKGATEKLEVVLAPIYTTEKNLAYTSSDENVITVENGVVTAVGVGTATVTVTGTGGVTAQIQITVVIEPESIAFEEDMYVIGLSEQESIQVLPMITPLDATYQDLIWETSNPEVCEVSDDGYIIAYKEGNATLKATIAGTEISDTVLIMVSTSSGNANVSKLYRVNNTNASGPFMYAVLDDGTVWVWGNYFETPVQLPIEQKVKEISVNSSIVTILDDEGVIHSYYGQNNSAENIANPTYQGKVALGSKIVSLEDSSYYSYITEVYAIDENGVVWNGNAGDVTSYVTVNIPEKVTKIISCYSSYNSKGVLYLTETGELYHYCNDYSDYSDLIPKKLSITGVTDIYNLTESKVVLETENGRIQFYITNGSYSGIATTAPSNAILTEKSNGQVEYYYINDNGNIVTNNGVIDELSNVKSAYYFDGWVYDANNFYAVTETDGVSTIYSQGASDYHMLGNGITEASDSFEKVYFGLTENSNGLSLTGKPGTAIAEPTGEATHTVTPGDKLIFDFNQAIDMKYSFYYVTIGIVDITDGSNLTVPVLATMDLDKLIVNPRQTLQDGHTYTVTIPADALCDRSGSANELITYTFLYKVDLDTITIDNGATATMDIDTSTQLNVSFVPSNTASTDVTYDSGDEKVVIVDENGLMQAVGAGETTVTVKSTVSDVSATITVKVVIPATSVEFGADTYTIEYTSEKKNEESQEEPVETLALGDVIAIENYVPVVKPANATNQNVIVESSDESVCYIDESGKLVAAGTGIAVLKATVAGTDLTDTITIIVTAEDYVQPEDVLTLEGWNGEEYTWDETSAYYIYSNKGVELDFNQVIAKGKAIDLITLTDAEGNEVPVKTTLNWDKLSILPEEYLVDGATYTLSVPPSSVKGWLDATNNEMYTFTFTYVLLDEREHMEDEELLGDRHYWTSAEVEGHLSQFKENGYNTHIYNNAILNRLDDDDVSKWLLFTADTNGYSTTGKEIPIGGNYWGTANDFLIDKQIVDFNDYQTLYDLNEGQILTEAPEDTFPFVVDAYVEVDGEIMDTVGNQEVTFVVKFNRDMDVSIPLEVRFGSSYPYSEYTIEGAYVTESEEDTGSKVWKGTTTLKTVIENGYQYWYIANGKSDPNADVDKDGVADGTSLKLYTDSGRFEFKIDTTAAQALIMQAEPTMEGIKLTWTQDDFDTLAGYRVYRSDEMDGYYSPITPTVIPAETMEWLDVNVTPGKTYYYTFTVVDTDLTESEPAVKVMATAYDSMAPNVYHDPVFTATTGKNLIISATIDDNLVVSGATLFYRTKGETTWKSAQMSNYNDSYSAMIPAAEVTVEGIEYYIVATDGISETYAGSAETPFEILVQVAVSDNEKGDVDGDGSITLMDALMVLLAINDRVLLDAEQFARADLDDSGALEAKEALRVLQYVNGTITSVLS